jgi:hypothetical protein
VNPLDLVMDGPKTVTAEFEVVTYQLTLNGVGNGSVQRVPDLPSYAAGSLVELTAQPAAGWAFGSWNGDTTATANPITLAMIRDRSLVATFLDQSPPSVTVVSPNGGEVVATGDSIEIKWNASDNAAVAGVDLLVSRNGISGPFEPIALDEPNDGNYLWVVNGSPTADAIVSVVARDTAGNSAADMSDGSFSITEPVLSAPSGSVTAFGLAAVVPNPTHGMTRIEYAVPVEARVRLQLVDVQGREVALLESGVRPPGRHRVEWSGAGHRGRVPPGGYFLRFETPGGVFVRRLVVMR